MSVELCREGLDDFTSDVNQTERRRVRGLEAFSGRVGCWSAKKKPAFILYGAPLPIGRHFIHTSTPNQNRTVGETENEGVEYTLSIYLLFVTLTSTDLRML